MAKRKSGRRTTIKSRAGTFYGKRTSRGRFKELDEKGRSLTAEGQQGDEVGLRRPR